MHFIDNHNHICYNASGKIFPRGGIYMKVLHKFFVGVLSFVLIVAMTTASTTIAMAASPALGDVTVLEQDANNVSNDTVDMASTYASIAAPTVIWDNTQYNMIVRYDWRVGRGGDEIAMSRNWQHYFLMGDILYRTYEFPENTGTNHCDPDYFLGKSYDSYSQTYSSSYTSLEHDVDMGDYILVRYGYESRYSAVGVFAYWVFSSESTVPTSYDKDYYIWKHNSSNGHTIKGTIQYKGQLADIEVKIPWIGYKTSSVEINGETFYLRTGPNKCSIKAASSNVHTHDLRFAFGVQ